MRPPDAERPRAEHPGPSNRIIRHDDRLRAYSTGAVQLADLVPFAIADELAEGLAVAAVALTERAVTLRLDRLTGRRRLADVIAGIRALADELAELADAIDGRATEGRSVAA